MVQSVTPTDNDVVCGRGRGYDMLAGNRAFRRLIKEHATLYSNSISTSRKRKSLITKTIREQLANENMRFLKKNKDGIWHEMGEKEIKLKIGHALRDAKEAVLTCGLSTRQATCTSSEADTCCSGILAAPPLADHDTVAKQQQSSEQNELPFPRDNDLITIVSADSSNVGDPPATCQGRVEWSLTPEQVDTAEEMMLIEMLLKSPSPTHQQLPAEVPSWSDAFVTSEICSGEEEYVSHLLTEELDNTLDDDFLNSLWDEEILKGF